MRTHCVKEEEEKCVCGGTHLFFLRQFNDSLHMENGMTAAESTKTCLQQMRPRETERESERVSESASLDSVAVSAATGHRHGGVNHFAWMSRGR